MASKMLRSMLVVIVVFVISFAAGWVYLTWDWYLPTEATVTGTPERPGEMPPPVVVPPPESGQAELLLEEIHALAARMREEDVPYEVLKPAKDKIMQLLSEPGVTDQILDSLSFPDDWNFVCLPPVPFAQGEVSLFSVTFYRADETPYFFLRYRQGDAVSVAEGHGRAEALRAVEIDGGSFAVAISVANKEPGRYSAGVYGLEDGRLFYLEGLDTGIYGYYGRLSAETESGALVIGNSDQPGQGRSRLLKRDGVLRFELLPAQTAATLPANYTEHGLLLGLSDDNGGCRTLWIRPAEQQLRISEISDAVVLPRGDGFGWLKNCRHTYTRGTGEETAFYLSKLLLSPLGEDPFGRLEDLTGQAVDIGKESSSTDLLYYVGEQYLCYVNRYDFAGDGTYRESVDRVRIVPLEEVNRAVLANPQTLPADIRAQIEGVKLYDLVGDEALRALSALPAIAYGPGGGGALDFGNMALVHDSGRWNLSVPVYDKGTHPGNGTNWSAIERFLPLNVEIPESLTGFAGWPEGAGMDVLSWKTQATDAVTPPDLKSFVTIGANGVSVCDIGMNELLATPARPGERVVSVRWAAPQDIPAWETALAPYFNKD